ncbi:MAG TPA: hypothetical protein VGR38_10065, partial [Candidatus Polarisedimenticolia bacterium]|nr:hypothetical protein [Candidatus Polarisedimenticolia bacterium]
MKTLLCCAWGSSVLACSLLLASHVWAQETTGEAKPYEPVTWKNGLQFQSEDGNALFRIGGYLQADGDFFLDDSQELATDTFFIR